MGKIIAMTGATGFAGRHAVAELLKRGHAVVALTRNLMLANLPEGVRLVQGDLESRPALEALVADADAVVHLAGAISGVTREDFFRVNVAGTENVMRAAAAAGISRIVHISSLAAREPQLSHYGASKRAGEAVVEGLVPRALIIRPPAVYGPGDKATLPLLKALTGTRAIIPGARVSRFSLIHVHDLARGIGLAVAGEGAGVVEVSDGTPGGYGWDDIASVAAHAEGHGVRPVFLPRMISSAAAIMVEGLARISGKPGVISRGKINELYHADWVARGPGLPLEDAITFARGFAETLAWYRAVGWLPVQGSAGRTASSNHEAGP